MGAELDCEGVVDGRRLRGKARLETSTLEFRSAAIKVVVKFAELASVSVKGERLVVCVGDRALELALGRAAAAKWADKILHPPTVLQKIGIKTGQIVVLIGDVDELFAAELSGVVSNV